MQKSNNVANSTAHPACASCKHQRKKCNEDCILAPYFPANQTREFQAVHKVFGVSNVMKLIKSVRQEDRKSVADSLVWEAICRQTDPILGPLGEYQKIQEELKLYQTRIQNPNQNQNQLVLQNQNQKSIISSWNGSNVINYDHNTNANLIVEQIPYTNYPLNYIQPSEQKIKRQEKIQLQPNNLHQQHSISATGFNHQQQYYLPGEFGSINGKTMDSTLWDGGA